MIQLKFFLQFILRFLSKLILRKYKPFIIGITGNVGKTSAKEAVFCVLAHKLGAEKIRKSDKNYNNEIGVPLTIIGAESGGKNIFRWIIVFLRAISLIIFKNKKYPSVLILEMGADRPGDIKYLTNFVSCNIGIVTAIGEAPVHIEFFKTPVQVARAKAALIQSLKIDGLAILNYDDEAVRRMAHKTQARVMSFGFNEKADITASDFHSGNFKVNYDGKNVNFNLENILGKHQIYPLLASIGVGLRFKMSLAEISQALTNYILPPGRMKQVAGLGNSLIIDDTYNASPLAMAEALSVLPAHAIARNMAGRKIAVLGDMLELGQYTEGEHRKIGKLVVKIIDILFTVGLRAKFIADEAEKSGMDKKNIFTFDTADEAKALIRDKVKKGDLILIKGSQGMRMEKIVKELMAEPERAGELLIRQGKEWLD